MFDLSRKEKKNALKKSLKSADMLFNTLTIQTFKKLLCEKSELKNVVYCINIDVQRLKDWESLNLFTSSVWPLQGDHLSETRMCISEIHWFYAYEFYNLFEASFAMHCKDENLHFINYLYEEDKYWVTISQSHVELLEQKFRETNDSYYLTECAQFLRHFAIYFSTSTLNEWNVLYKVTHQKAEEVIITYSWVYHQGFSAGYMFTEAVNYAGQNWNIQGYQECDSQYCSEGFIEKKMLKFQNENKEQHSERSSENNKSLAEETQT